MASMMAASNAPCSLVRRLCVVCIIDPLSLTRVHQCEAALDRRRSIRSVVDSIQLRFARSRGDSPQPIDDQPHSHTSRHIAPAGEFTHTTLHDTSDALTLRELDLHISVRRACMISVVDVRTSARATATDRRSAS
jgi:hypothetical protein